MVTLAEPCDFDSRAVSLRQVSIASSDLLIPVISHRGFLNLSRN